MRLNKFLAACGIASRRDCDKLIAEGRVCVNGKAAVLGVDVSDSDCVTVDGRQVTLKKNEYYLLNKPKGYLSTVSDEKGRKTVLLILTTDGELAQRLTHPSNEVPKTYLVKIEGTLKESDLNPLRSGIEIEGGYVTKKCKAHIVETNKQYTKIHMTITEGKNREIRKMFAVIGREVVLLKRIKVGELTLRGLDRGSWRKLSRQEVEYLMSL